MYHQKLHGIEGIFSLFPHSLLAGLEMSANLRIQERVQDGPEGSILVFSFHPEEMHQVHKLGTQKHVFAIAQSKENVRWTRPSLGLYQFLYLEAC